MESAAAWWLASTLLGVIAIPYGFVAFSRLPDRGLCFARPLGLLLSTYLLWLAGVAHVVPNGRGAALLAVVVFAAGGLVLFKQQRAGLTAFLQQQRRTVLVYEAAYLAAFVIMALLRAYNPQLDSTEKPMDLAMLTSALRSPSLPPLDPWLSGFTVNYYYFGYLMMATLTNLAGTPASIGFNLSLAFLFAAAAVAMLGLIANLVTLMRSNGRGAGGLPLGAMRSGGIGVLMLLTTGNLVGVLEMLRAHGFEAERLWRWLSIKVGGDGPAGPLLLGVPPDRTYLSAHWYPTENWWWWRSTRVIDTIVGGRSADYTITEFPFFSFLLGDLHPHVMSLPFGLLALGLCLQLFLQPVRSVGDWVRAHRVQGLLTVVGLGSLGFINGWDIGPYLALFLGVGAVRVWLDCGLRDGRAWLNFGGLVLAVVAGMGVAFGLFYVPIIVQVLLSRGSAPAEGGTLPLGFWTGSGTRPLHFLLFWAVDAVCCGAFMVVALRRTARSLLPLALPVLAGALCSAAAAEAWWLQNPDGDPAGSPFRLLQHLWLAGPLVVALSVLLHRRRIVAANPEAQPADAEARVVDADAPTPAPPDAPVDSDVVRFVAGLLAAALLLLLVSEWIFVRDVFGNRMNTVFKLWYQAWVWLAVAGAFGVAYVAQGLRRVQGLMWGGVVGTVLVLCSVYAVAAMLAKTDGFLGPATLDGLAYLRQSDPDELQAVRWLGARPAAGEVVLEATGGQYSFFGRAATISGIPSVLGWAGHESQWRGSDRSYRDRTGDIDAIYGAADKRSVGPLLAKYQITYVYVGRLERDKYPKEALDAFGAQLPVAYQNATVTIYRVREPEGLS